MNGYGASSRRHRNWLSHRDLSCFEEQNNNASTAGTTT